LIDGLQFTEKLCLTSKNKDQIHSSMKSCINYYETNSYLHRLVFITSKRPMVVDVADNFWRKSESLTISKKADNNTK